MDKVAELLALKKVLVDWGMLESKAKDQALRLVFGYEGSANLFGYEPQSEQQSCVNKVQK